MEGSNSFKVFEKIMIFGDNDVGKTSIIRRLGKKKLEFSKEKTKNSNIYKININNNIIKWYNMIWFYIIFYYIYNKLSNNFINNWINLR